MLTFKQIISVLALIAGYNGDWTRFIVAAAVLIGLYWADYPRVQRSDVDRYKRENGMDS